MDDRQPVRMPLAEAAEYVHRLIVSCVPSWPKDISGLIAAYGAIYVGCYCGAKEVYVDNRSMGDHFTSFAVDGNAVAAMTRDRQVYLLPICEELPSDGIIARLMCFLMTTSIGKAPRLDGLIDGVCNTGSSLTYVNGGKLTTSAIHPPALATIGDKSGIVTYDRHGRSNGIVYPVRYDDNYRAQQIAPSLICVERKFYTGRIVTGLARVDADGNITAYHDTRDQIIPTSCIYECGGGNIIVKQKSTVVAGEVTISVFAAGVKKCSFGVRGTLGELEIFTDKKRPVFYIWHNDGKRLERMTRYTITDSYWFL